jgi:quercetin dioxygenase-like cupin family protein
VPRVGKALGKFLAVGLLLAIASVARAGSAGEQMAVHQILNTTTTATGQAIVLPNNPRVIGSIVVLPPGYAPGYHKHPFPRYAYVLSGELEVQDKSGGTRRYGPGQMFVETVNAWHRPRVEGSVPVRLVVIDQIPSTAHTNTINE